MDELQIEEPREKEVPRWVRVVMGLIIGLFTLLCGVGATTMLVVPNERSPILVVVLGLLLLLACLWVLEKCFRMITGRKNRGGLMTPNTLRVLSFFFLALPVAAIFTGYYRKEGPFAIFHALMYVSIFFGLQKLARAREAREVSKEQAKK